MDEPPASPEVVLTRVAVAPEGRRAPAACTAGRDIALEIAPTSPQWAKSAIVGLGTPIRHGRRHVRIFHLVELYGGRDDRPELEGLGDARCLRGSAPPSATNPDP